jgi:general secretion pathway protein G
MKRGFTLVEILIVVIILGILAAIVIPQFTNASEDARKSSLVSQLQTLRSQVELYKLEHREAYPTDDNSATGAWDWDKLTKKTDEDGTVNETTGIRGPYLQAPPVNGLTGGSDMVVVTDDATATASTTSNVTAATPDARDGFVFSSATGKTWAYGKPANGSAAVYQE